MTLSPFAESIRRWYIVMLSVGNVLLILRWFLGDRHGALLMMAVEALGILSVVAREGGVDGMYVGCFGLMAFLSGLLDLNIAIEHLSRAWGSKAIWKLVVRDDASCGCHLACTLVQLCSALLATLLYREIEDLEESDDEPLFLSQDQVRVYHSVVAHVEQRPSAGEPLPMSPEEKAFVGKAHKLPP